MKRSFLAIVPVILLMATACLNTAESTFQDTAAENESVAVTESAALTESDAITESTPVTAGDEKSVNRHIVTFPAYKIENPGNLPFIDSLNAMEPFSAELDLPSGWEIKDTKGSETLPTGEFYTPVYIYEGDKIIGYIAFNVFEPYTGEIPAEEYYKTVYPNLRLSSFYHWDPYTAVKTTDMAETGIAEIEYIDPNVTENYTGAMSDAPRLRTIGILSYNKELGVYIGIAFMPDTIDREQAEEIAQTVGLSK
jgi:hypothetical protein